MPFLAEVQTEVFYLPMTLLTLFVHGGRLDVFWLQLVNILHYWLAGVGMFMLARSYNLYRIPSLFAGIVYAFSGFMVVHGIHQVILVVVAWFPLILWLFRKSFSSLRDGPGCVWPDSFSVTASSADHHRCHCSCMSSFSPMFCSNLFPLTECGDSYARRH